ncbi:recombinase family protein [Vibrio parahaemolyticus]|nr:recombinase family protein [Vibrio parahaemolyticus]
MTTQRIGYIRVSSLDQNPERQLSELNLDKVFKEWRSGKSRNERPILHDCIDYIREGDELYINSIDRLARNIINLQALIDKVTAKGASIHCYTEKLKFDDSDDLFSELFATIGGFHLFEPKLIKIRSREGMKAARRKGSKLACGCPDHVYLDFAYREAFK